MTDRKAPGGGYDFAEKSEYRERVWTEFKHRVDNPALSHALLMPSLEGLEIDVALAKGFREERLHIVDFNPAIVATLKRRYPKINTYGVSVERACRRISDKGVALSAANFDLTSNASTKTILLLNDIARSGALATEAVVAVTLLRGRESGFVGRILSRIDATEMESAFDYVSARAPTRDMLPTDLQRVLISAVVMAGGRNAETRLVRTSYYKSGTQTMMWSLFSRVGYRPRRGRRARRQLTRANFNKLALLLAAESLIDRDYGEDEALRLRKTLHEMGALGGVRMDGGGTPSRLDVELQERMNDKGSNINLTRDPA